MKTSIIQSWITCLGLMVVLSVPETHGGAATGAAKGLRELAEAIAEQAGKKGSKEVVEQTTKELADISAKYGDEGLIAVDQYGASALRVMKNAGQDAGEYLPKAINRYGSDALRLAESPAGRQVLREGNEAVIKAVAKHTESALPMIREVGESAARALDSVDSKNGRRLLQMHGENVFKEADFDQVVSLIGKYGDRMCEFIYKHRKVLGGAGALAIVAANAEKVIDGTFDLGKELGKEAGGVAKHAIDKINLNLWIGVALCLISVSWLIKRRMSLASGKEPTNDQEARK